jgi:hypothetical protein
MSKLTGLLPRTKRMDEICASEREFSSGADDRKTIVQHVGQIRDQRQKPSCVGQALAAGIDGAIGAECEPSAVDIWRDARRRQGNLEGVLDGTRLEYGIESVMKRGWSPHEEGEDSRPVSEDDDAVSSLSDELYAYDVRQAGVKHYDIRSDHVARALSALHLGLVVVGGWGLRSAFYSAPSNATLGPGYLDADDNGHAMRVYGYDAATQSFLLQNSWGKRWCTGGTCRITEAALRAAWEINVMEIKL